MNEGITELTRAVIEYQQKSRTISEVFRLAAPIIYAFPKRSRKGDEDDCGEFLLYFYPRFLRLLTKFKFQAPHSFEAYLCTAMRFQYTTFCLQRSRRLECCENHELFYRVQETPEIILPETRVASLLNPAMLAEKLKHACGLKQRRYKALRKRIIILALLNSEGIDRSSIDICARAAEVKTEILEAMILKLRHGIYKNKKHINTLRMRRNNAFAQLITLQQKAARHLDGHELKTIRQKIERCRRILANARQQLLNTKPVPLQSEIANIMGIPKGSVHTAVSYLKRIASHLEEPNNTMVLSGHDDTASQQQPAQITGNTTDCRWN